MACFAEILEAELDAADRLDGGRTGETAPNSAVPDLSWFRAAAPAPVAHLAPMWARTLGVAFPCTERELRAAFRRRAFATHPDRTGGPSGPFLEARAALETGLRDVSATMVRVRRPSVDRYRSCAA